MQRQLILHRMSVYEKQKQCATQEEMNEMKAYLRNLVFAAVVIGMTAVFTGCSGMSWSEMQDKGKELLEQGKEVNRQLESEAEKVNSGLTSENMQFGDGWSSVLGKNNIRIQYAQSEEPENKIMIEDTKEWLSQLLIEQWEPADSFPTNGKNEIVFFIQQPINEEEPNGDYKNIANLRYFPENDCIAITVGKGLLDLSDTFEVQEDGFTSVYRVPEDTIKYLKEQVN